MSHAGPSVPFRTHPASVKPRDEGSLRFRKGRRPSRIQGQALRASGQRFSLCPSGIHSLIQNRRPAGLECSTPHLAAWQRVWTGVVHTLINN
jgi:hypothetical protein